MQLDLQALRPLLEAMWAGEYALCLQLDLWEVRIGSGWRVAASCGMMCVCVRVRVRVR